MARELVKANIENVKQIESISNGLLEFVIVDNTVSTVKVNLPSGHKVDIVKADSYGSNLNLIISKPNTKHRLIFFVTLEDDYKLEVERTFDTSEEMEEFIKTKLSFSQRTESIQEEIEVY